MLSLFLLHVAATAGDMAQLWNTDSQGAYTSLDPITGTVLTTLKCKDPTKCAEQQQREGVVMADVYYTIRYHHAPTLHGFDLTTGNVSCLIKLPFQQFGFSAFGMGVYGLAADEKRGRLLAIGPMAPFGAASYAHALFSIDPINGTYTQVGQANLAPLPASSSTFDPEARVFYTLYAVGISTSVLGIAVDDGSVVGDGCILQEGSLVDRNAMLEPGSVLPSGARVPSGEVYGGSPASFVRKLSKEELTEFQVSAEATAALAAKHADEFLPYGTLYQLKDEMVAVKAK